MRGQRAVRPTLLKMGGVWLWSCPGDHGGPIGECYRPGEWRDPWTAALASATKHAAMWHDTDEGEDV